MAGHWVQKVIPFLDDSKLVVKSGGKVLYDWYGWCLAVTDASFGVAPFAESAIKAWNVNPDKFPNVWDIPLGFYVPIFWSGGQYGHVAIIHRTDWDRATIYSSPYTHKPYFDVFSGSIDEVVSAVTRKYGLTKCLGWTASLGGKPIAAWEPLPEAAKPEPQKKPEPVPEEKEPATEDSSASTSQETENKNGDDADHVPSGDTSAIVSPTAEHVSKTNFIKLLEENVNYMEKFQEVISDAGNSITFKPLTKKIVYVVCDLLLLAGAEVNPIVTILNAQNVEMFATALTQALFTAGIGGLLIFKLLKAKGGAEKVPETIDKSE